MRIASCSKELESMTCFITLSVVASSVANSEGLLSILILFNSEKDSETIFLTSSQSVLMMISSIYDDCAYLML